MKSGFLPVEGLHGEELKPFDEACDFHIYSHCCKLKSGWEAGESGQCSLAAGASDRRFKFSPWFCHLDQERVGKAIPLPQASGSS